ncbi:ankyrin repeat domain-containing protein [bacterium]|nr:ankyrin repeat domain-containing protein [bacterium]
MNDLFPHAMFVTRRALCPGCGAPMPLGEGGPGIRCSYCGVVAQVERRLRTKEPEHEPEKKVPLDWTPSHLIRGGESEIAACSACGAEVVILGDQDIVPCKSCSGVSKVERRMRRVEPLHVEAGEDAHVVRLLARLRTSTDLAERVTLAKDAFDSWSCVNDTMAGRIGEVFEVLETADPRLAHAAGEVVGKLLCSDNVLYHAAVLAAAERHLFHKNASRVLLYQLGLGPGLCMKRLLDAADVLWRHGEVERGSTALWAANTLLGRNYPDHPTIAAIVLYRMLYLHGPVLAWALKFARGEGGIGYRYATATLIQFIDDCAVERPGLVPEIRRAFHGSGIEHATDYGARLDLYSKLATTEARATLLRLLPPPPKGTALRVAKAAHDVLAGALDDPGLSGAATEALVVQMKQGVPASIHALVKERRDALPEALRRAYLEQVKDSPHLSPLPPKYWESEKPEPTAPELAEAARLYDEGIHLAVNLWNKEAESLSHYWEIIRERSPLMVAAGRGEVEKVKELRAQGDVNATNAFGRTALMFAAENGHALAIRALEADRSRRDRDGKTAIMLAAEGGHEDAVRALLGTASLDQEALRVAFQADRVEIMRILLESGADPDGLEEDGSTPLMECAKRGRLDKAAVLLDAQAQIDHQDNGGKSSLMHAAEAGHADMAALLIRRGANVDLTTPEEDSALILAARAGHEAVVALLAGKVAFLNRRGPGGKSALAWAQESGHAAVARALVASGASLAGDEVLLVEAVEKRDLERVRELLDAGMTPDVRDKDGQSVLHRSIRRSEPEVFWLLLERGAKPDAEDLVRLVVVYWKEAIPALLSRGLHVDARDHRGETALMVAAMKGYVDIAELLLSKGADRSLTDARGDDAVEFAKMRRDNDEMIRLLGG